MADARLAYLVRDAGSPSRPGRVFKMYPYTLRALLNALDDARLRSYSEGPQLVIRVEGTTRVVFRRYDGGREAPIQRSKT
jgi:hypothetical protein